MNEFIVVLVTSFFGDPVAVHQQPTKSITSLTECLTYVSVMNDVIVDDDLTAICMVPSDFDKARSAFNSNETSM